MPIGAGHSLLQGLACVATTLTEISLSSAQVWMALGADVAETQQTTHGDTAQLPNPLSRVGRPHPLRARRKVGQI